ncbi:hypothetical protein DTO013E5_4140 [Penicillium roqueforti]|uniref:Genomic scaffold, ProqFM164S01 n=1 Tax=Penicillium roqueforti (strain FM164) TaxID=1365484 RepID=W6PST3_PENRF|nr:hypothetical protein CBS147337_3855 [Penicillium roqueforti]CDM26935.1 unnamed protein product [Penicillium roqueforti FM164]KAI2677051.1 hypothetical protein CBS147355_5278 [Penicillium roqueforti]KAI2688650.1 hypothetical protein LCP963914a_3052 [Penicillium roqueforti]KAI2694869.1 hypothetical protein CBS147372_9532 [Penicillium roqueforti]
MSSYAYCARQFARAAVINELTRQRTYLHSIDMKYRPSYPTYRSEPVGNFSSRRRYDSNVRLSTRQPRYNRTQKNVRFDDSGYEYEPRSSSRSSSRGHEYEYRSPAQGPLWGPRSQNTWDSNPASSRYETDEPGPVKRGLQEMSGSGRRVLGQRRRAPCVLF